MQIKFTKMEGLGNDFVVLDVREQARNLNFDNIRHIACRRTGIGCDQVLLIDNPVSVEANFSYKVFNSDGSPAEHCGNGFRCVALYFSQKQGDSRHLCAEVDSKLYYADIISENRVKANMGKPNFKPQDIGRLEVATQPEYEFNSGEETLKFGAVSMGNPHAVLKVENLNDINVPALGKAIQKSAGFRNGVNVGFFQLYDASTIDLKVWERGVGLTPACGTGACAAMAVGAKWGLLNNVVDVRQEGGNLQIEWNAAKNGDLTMTGPANHVFEGTMSI